VPNETSTMNHQPPAGPPSAASPPHLRSSLRSLPSLRRSLRSLSRGRRKAAGKGECCDDDDDDDDNDEQYQQQQQGPLVEAERAMAALRTPNDDSISNNKNNHLRSGDKNNRSSTSGNSARKSQEEETTDRAKLPSLLNARGRSRSRVRAFLRRGSDDRTAETARVETPDTSASPNAARRDRGRSKSRLRRLFLGSADRSKSRLRVDGDGDGRETTAMNTADPLGLQGGRDRDRRSAAAAQPAPAEGADSAAAPHEFARFRSAVVETLPSDSCRGVGRNESGQLSELSSLQQPPTDLLPIHSGVLAVTAASRRLMRSVSLLGMEDPVLRVAKGPVDVDLVVDDEDVNDAASALEDVTATSDDGGGFDRRMFDQLLLLEATNANDWIRAVSAAASPDLSQLEGQSDGRNEGPRKLKDENKQSAVVNASRSAIQNKKPNAAPPNMAGSLGADDEPTADSTARETSVPPSFLPQLDATRSSRAFQPILDRPPSNYPAERTSMLANHHQQPLSRAEVDTVLAALAHSHKKQLQERRRNRRRESLDGVEPGFVRQRIRAEGELGAGPGDNAMLAASSSSAASSTHSARTSVADLRGGPTNRVVVKVRVKRRSTLDYCAFSGGGAGGGAELLRSHPNRASRSGVSGAAAAQSIYRAPVAAAAAAAAAAAPVTCVRGDRRSAIKPAEDNNAAATTTSTAVQELMSRPRRLPDMDSVFA
jgi:hypothetical protein